MGAITILATICGVALQAQPVDNAPGAGEKRSSGTPGAGPANAAPEAHASTGEQKKAEEMIIPVLQFRELTASEALNVIASAADLKVFYTPKAGDPTRLTMQVKNIPASEALRYVADLANLKLTYKKDGIYLSNTTAPEPQK